MSPSSRQHPQKRRPALFKRLLIGVNLALVVVVGVFMLWDYLVAWNAFLTQKRTALEEEAKVILPSVVWLQKGGLDAVQSYIDEICGRMQETTSPGHHIAVRIGDDVLQARAHHRSSPAIFVSMQQAVANPIGTAAVGENMIVVGSEAQGATVVYVSEYLSNIRRTIRLQMIRRLASVLLLGVALLLVVNIAVNRLLAKPLRSMVQVVQRIAEGDLNARMPERRTMELGLLADEFDRMAHALQQLETERQYRMKKARKIQDNLRPHLAGFPDLAVACIYQPADQVAGDYYDVVRCRDGSTLFCIADVTGHGVPAAMGAAMLKILFDSASRETCDPVTILKTVNAAFSRVTLEGDFASMAVAAVNPAAGSVRYASAGHEPIILLPRNGPAELLRSTGPLLGIQEGGSWIGRQVTLNPEDRLVLFSDGVTETASGDNRLFGVERLVGFLEESKDAEIEQICHRLGEVLADFRRGADSNDDVTMMVVERKKTG